MRTLFLIETILVGSITCANAATIEDAYSVVQISGGSGIQFVLNLNKSIRNCASKKVPDFILADVYGDYLAVKLCYELRREYNSVLISERPNNILQRLKRN